MVIGKIVDFDGVSNVQKGGMSFIIYAKFLKCTVVHGTEHVVSLFMGEIFQEECLKIMKNIFALFLL